MIFILAVILLGGGQFTGGDQETETARCIACHQRLSLVRGRNSIPQFTISVSPEVYRHSDHGQISCIQCHGDCFSVVPHIRENRRTLQCGDCHMNDIMPCSGYLFSDYEHSHGGDIHIALIDGFHCGSCHDAHILTVSRCEPPEHTNTLCLRCHPGISLIAPHIGFPGTRLHLEHCSCGDCHFPTERETVSHFVLPGDASLKDCRSCHSKTMAADLFPNRVHVWEKRHIPGWRSGMTIEIIFVIVAIALWTGALFLRLAASGPHALTRFLPPGPSARIRGLSIVILFITGFIIYAGNGFLLGHSAHIHVLAGVLLLAVIVERIFLIRGLPSRAMYRVLIQLRSILIGILLVTGVLLLTPSITGMIDTGIPIIRIIHRFSATVLLIWLTAIALRD